MSQTGYFALIFDEFHCLFYSKETGYFHGKQYHGTRFCSPEEFEQEKENIRASIPSFVRKPKFKMIEVSRDIHPAEVSEPCLYSRCRAMPGQMCVERWGPYTSEPHSARIRNHEQRENCNGRVDLARDIGRRLNEAASA